MNTDLFFNAYKHNASSTFIYIIIKYISDRYAIQKKKLLFNNKMKSGLIRSEHNMKNKFGVVHKYY